MQPGTSSQNARRPILADKPLIAYGKLFGWLAAGTFTLIVVIGFAVWVHGKLQPSPNDPWLDIAAAIPEDVLIEVLKAEVAGLQSVEQEGAFHTGKASQQLIMWLTGIDLRDPRSIMAAEINGLTVGSISAAGDQDSMVESDAPADSKLPTSELKPEQLGTIPRHREEQVEGQAPDAADEFLPELDIPVSAGLEERQKVKVFIYHSHNRESWVPELEGVKHPNEAYDEEINITLLGKRLAKRLEEEGIGTKVSDKDYPSAIRDFNYNHSYSYSLKTVQEAAITYPELQYYFDIHRDSQKRGLTTATIGGVDYAQVYFIIGKQNPNWQQNEAFAQRIHDKLEELYPGLSRGILGKNAQTGNGEYNQHISPNAILIEVGGPENTLEESYRTIDVLAEVLSELFWEAEKVDAPVLPGEIVAAATRANDGRAQE
jgi:stage II sporulation protein P